MTSQAASSSEISWGRRAVVLGITAAVGGVAIYSLYNSWPSAHIQQSRSTRTDFADSPNAFDKASKSAKVIKENRPSKQQARDLKDEKPQQAGILADWSSIPDRLINAAVPEWAQKLPGYIAKLQQELSGEQGTLAEEIWREAQDPSNHPEIAWDAYVRVSEELCDQEKSFLELRKQYTKKALSKYLHIPEDEIHPDDVPVISLANSGGGLRALVAGASSMYSASEAGLFQCATYTAGVSGSCWLQSLYNSSISGQDLGNVITHLKDRINIHIAYPPSALQLVTSAPTNKFLLSGGFEKFKGLDGADFGVVDIYGLLLGARLLVPKDEISVDPDLMKVSNQRKLVEHGAQPLPIYSAVRHEIPEGSCAKSQKEAEKQSEKEAWFQWFEMTPFELYSEEMSAGIPTWSIGRTWSGGKSQPRANGEKPLPEIRLPLLMGIWGSAFCATLSHYYHEIKPVVKGLTGFGGLDGMIEERNEDLIRLHPVQPASIPNFALGMRDQLPATTSEGLHASPKIELMDAGMSNNLPLYPLLRRPRDVDIIVTFDASADVKHDNWLRVADGYSRQHGIKGWPVGTGWPTQDNKGPEHTAKALNEADRINESTSQHRLDQAIDKQKQDLGVPNSEAVQDARQINASSGDQNGDIQFEGEPSHAGETTETSELGPCTVWVGTAEERTAEDEPPQSKRVEADWELMRPDAGIAVIYFPFLANPKVEGVDPMKSEFMSTWNFIYEPDQVDKVVELAKANFEDGAEKTKMVVRAVYERKKRQRLEREKNGTSDNTKRRRWKDFEQQKE